MRKARAGKHLRRYASSVWGLWGQQTLERHQDLESDGYHQSQSWKGWNTHLELWSYERILWPWLEDQCIQEEQGQLQTGLGTERHTAVDSSRRSSPWYVCGRWRKGARNRRARVSNILKKILKYYVYIMCMPSARRGHGISSAGLWTVGNHQVDEEQQELLTTKPSLQLQNRGF